MKQADPDAPPLWRFIDLKDYDRPPEPAREKVRRGLWRLWDRLVRTSGSRGQGEAERGSSNESEDRFLEVAVQDPDWQDAVPALDEALQDWLSFGRENGPLRVVLSAPYSGVRQMATLLALRKNWRVIEPPGARQLLTGEGERLRELEVHDETPWLVPAMGEWYLRHGNGLDLMRQFLDLLASRRQLTLVCCDTWAWAYLNKTVQTDLVFPAPLILAAFNQQRLGCWFPSLIRLNGERPAVFRQSNNGRYVLPPTVAGDEGPPPEMSDFLGRLAAYSHGIPGIAWAGWRHNLRSVVIEDQKPAAPPRFPPYG